MPCNSSAMPSAPASDTDTVDLLPMGQPRTVQLWDGKQGHAQLATKAQQALLESWVHSQN